MTYVTRSQRRPSVSYTWRRESNKAVSGVCLLVTSTTGATPLPTAGSVFHMRATQAQAQHVRTEERHVPGSTCKNSRCKKIFPSKENKGESFSKSMSSELT